MIRVLVDCRHFGPRPSGVGRYISCLVRHLIPASSGRVFLFFLTHTSRENFLPLPGSGTFDVLTSPFLPESHGASEIWQHTFFKGLLRRHRIDLVHSTAYVSPLIPFPVPWITSLHDLAAYRRPDTLPFLFRLYLRCMTAAAVRHADGLIVLTDAVKQDLARLFPKTPEVAVIALGASPGRLDPEDHSRPHDLPPQYVLTVGNLEPRKGLENLIRAYNHLRASHHDLQPHLILCGQTLWNYDAPRRWVRNSPYASSIHFTGYVSEERLEDLYRFSAVTAIPSEYEGFGLPVLEALRTGAPVLVNREPALMEAGGTAVHVADFKDTAQAATLLATLLSEPWPNPSRLARHQRHLETFSWERTAELTLDLYEKTIHGTCPST